MRARDWRSNSDRAASSVTRVHSRATWFISAATRPSSYSAALRAPESANAAFALTGNSRTSSSNSPPPSSTAATSAWRCLTQICGRTPAREGRDPASRRSDRRQRRREVLRSGRPEEAVQQRGRQVRRLPRVRAAADDRPLAGRAAAWREHQPAGGGHLPRSCRAGRDQDEAVALEQHECLCHEVRARPPRRGTPPRSDWR